MHPSIALGTAQTATSPAITVMIAANVIEYVNLNDISHSIESGCNENME